MKVVADPMAGRANEGEDPGLVFKIAALPHEFEAVHRLNYETFVEEIPQHPPNECRSRIDRFHMENTYAVCLAGGQLVGMVSGRCARPFSLDAKLAGLDGYLPAHRKLAEVRLLSVRRGHRNTQVFARLIETLGQYLVALGCDLVVISGTVRQLKLYRHLGFTRFAVPVGTAEAMYQPMYLTLLRWEQRRTIGRSFPQSPVASFLPGPVVTTRAVRDAFQRNPVSHRSADVAAQMARVRVGLRTLTGASDVIVISGSGTLANEAVAAQLHCLDREGLVLANGEFGHRLVDHAVRWKLRCEVEQRPWGEPIGWESLRRKVRRSRPSWIWAVLSETSTGVENSLDELLQLSESVGGRLCVDAVSAIGIKPIQLRDTWLASGVSGKGLASLSGLAMVFHDGRLSAKGLLPAYLDLATYQSADSIPFTLSSNLLAALDCAVSSTDWAAKFQRIKLASNALHAGLRTCGLAPLAASDIAMPGIITVPLPFTCDAARVCAALAAAGVQVAFESEYLRRRNWVQICLMGEFDQSLIARLPGLLAAAVSEEIFRGTQPLDERSMTACGFDATFSGGMVDPKLLERRTPHMAGKDW